MSHIHLTLRNRLYTGEFEWKGRVYRGRHQPLVARELWERVQGVLNGRNARKTRRGVRDFAFSGLISCGHCGCAMVGEIKKGRYVSTITAPATRENALSPMFARRSYQRSSLKSSAASALVTRSCNG
jgi:site-specific DNA recombinase